MLSREDIVGVASRIFAIFLFVITVRLMSQMFSPLMNQDWPLLVVGLATSLAIVPLLIAALLWFFPLTVARKLLPVMSDSAPTGSGRPAELEMLAFSVVGAWVLASALADTAYWLVFAFIVKNSEYENVRISAEHVADMWSTGIQLLIGAYLLFGARGLVGLLRRARYAGAYIPEPDDPTDAGQGTTSTQDPDPRS